ncbi:DUF3240 family protein [Elongatibacter sediminis]|uniref:DUF3240 family protein n=1 Tax=Elongatibacter sediminis TaxID=3119006 RepID=A0AAW9R6R4_9GAMM
MEYLLRLNIPPNLEEDVVDFLLGSDGIKGFQSLPVRGHGLAGAMSIAEQVAGRRQRIQFEIMLDADRLDALLQRLEEAFPVRDAIYWVTPIVRSGRLLATADS